MTIREVLTSQDLRYWCIRALLGIPIFTLGVLFFFDLQNVWGEIGVGFERVSVLLTVTLLVCGLALLIGKHARIAGWVLFFTSVFIAIFTVHIREGFEIALLIFVALMSLYIALTAGFRCHLCEFIKALVKK